MEGVLKMALPWGNIWMKVSPGWAPIVVMCNNSQCTFFFYVSLALQASVAFAQATRHKILPPFGQVFECMGWTAALFYTSCDLF